MPISTRTLLGVCLAPEGMRYPPHVAAVWPFVDTLTRLDGSLVGLHIVAHLLIGVDAYWRLGEALDVRVGDAIAP